MKITHKITGSVIHETAAEKIRDVLMDAVKKEINLSGADLSGADLSNANLSGANLSGADLRYADLSDANLRYADLRYADLSDANLRYADLSDANLRYADLSNANLRYAKSITAPAIEDLDGRILKAIEAGGKLEMGQWHTCETTHCRAGWAIHFAGDFGKSLEDRIGPSAAGALIYWASCKRIPNFFATNEEAMEDIKKGAAK